MSKYPTGYNFKKWVLFPANDGTLVAVSQLAFASAAVHLHPLQAKLETTHRHLRNIDCLMACTACLVCFISTVHGRSKKERKEACYVQR
jgi:hypothetical protein